jgi:hypothetical protein
MGRWHGVAWAAFLFLVPAAAAARQGELPPGPEVRSPAPPAVVVEAEGPDDTEEFDADAEVAGEPLPPARGRVRTEPVPPPPAMVEERDDGWGLPEHRLYVVPAEVEQPPLYSGDVARIPEPPWPGKHLLGREAFPTAWTFPELYPMVNAALSTTVGRLGESDDAVFIERAELNLWLLEVGVDLVRAFGDRRESEPTLDLDLRIPVSLGPRQQLALIPGISFPKIDDVFAARTRLAYGAGVGPLAFQVNGGYAAGTRPAGLLGTRRDLSGSTFLAGALVALRVHDKLEPRVEGDFGFGTGGHPDYGTLAAGLTVFPWGDPRLELGIAGILEDASGDMFSEPSVGALFELQLNFQ